MDGGVQLFILLIAGSQFYILIRSWYVWWRIENDGVLYTAKVISVTQIRSRWITYSFDAPLSEATSQHIFTARKPASRSTCIQAQSRADIQIKYLPTDPNVSLIVGDNSARNVVTVICSVILIVVLAVGLKG